MSSWCSPPPPPPGPREKSRRAASRARRYAAESFPGITQALSDGDKELAQEQVLVVAACVMDAAEFLSGGTTP